MSNPLIGNNLFTKKAAKRIGENLRSTSLSIADDLISVQPMQNPCGEIFKLKVTLNITEEDIMDVHMSDLKEI